MRDLFKKVMTGSMIAGAALLVSACGGGENAEANNTAMTDLNAMDPMMETTNDVTAIDAGTGADANMTMDANATSDMNMTTTNTTVNTTTTTTDTNLTNGM